MQFINWRASKKKANLDNTDLEVDTLNKVIDTLQESNQHFETVNQQREDKIRELRKECSDLIADLTTCQSLLCRKMVCRKKEPITGMGKDFLEKFKRGEAELDYESE